MYTQFLKYMEKLIYADYIPDIYLFETYSKKFKTSACGCVCFIKMYMWITYEKTHVNRKKWSRNSHFLRATSRGLNNSYVLAIY